MLFGVRFAQVLVTSSLYKLHQDCNYSTAEKSLYFFHLSNKRQCEIEDKVLWKKTKQTRNQITKYFCPESVLMISTGEEGRERVFAASLRGQ